MLLVQLPISDHLLLDVQGGTVDADPFLGGFQSHKSEGMEVVWAVVALRARQRFDFADPAAVMGNVMYAETWAFRICGRCQDSVVGDFGLQWSGRAACRGPEGVGHSRR